MPETTRSGSPLNTCVTAMFTQSVGGVPSTAKTLIRHRLEPQRPSQRQRVADRARLLHRSDDGHVPGARSRVDERVNALRPVTIVIREQNPDHPGRL